MSLTVAEKIAARVMARPDWQPRYTDDLLLEALLVLGDTTGNQRYRDFVRDVLAKRGWLADTVVSYRAQPFCCTTFELYRRLGDGRFAQPFLAETDRYRHEAPRSFDGAISHYGDPKMGRILIDQLQDYAIRLCRAGALSGDESYFAEALAQYEMFRAALTDLQTGLWGHARGWFGEDPAAVVTTPWLRGQGWVLRGMVESLASLPARSKYADRLRAMLNELAGALVRYQDATGMWHQVVDEPDSYPETSGTGFIVHYLWRAGYCEPAERGYRALLGFVGADGAVRNGCIGTGPQPTRENYRRRPAVVDDPHAVAAVMLALCGPALVETSK
jgi:rhamnogalacturonyl hydrolase YesR